MDNRDGHKDRTDGQLTPNSPIFPAPLAVFRVGFGLMMALSIVRFWWNGWIEKLYLEPTYFFSYRYFEWVKPLGPWTYGLFVLAFISAIMVMVGWRYRLAIVAFFLSFTYIELMDKTTYLNHHYFVSLLSLLLIWLPAADYFSVDKGTDPNARVPRWTIDALKIFVGVVYFYAGLAKLNSDWLLEAQPLSIWLPAKYDIPLLGGLVHERWVHYAFSWSGAAYDLLITFLLLWRPTRPWAFVAVVVFHVLTRVLFPIGMFPYIMIVSALVFFSGEVHERIIHALIKTSKSLRAIIQKITPIYPGNLRMSNISGARPQVQKEAVKKQGPLPGFIVATILLAHLLVPWRYAFNPGELFWTEAGYRFSWRVMLMEKAGYLTYKVVDPRTGKRRTINPADHLTTFQNKQLATQPDIILEFAHHIATLHRQKNGPLPAVYAESYVALNGRGSRVYVNPDVNLTAITEDTPRTAWLMPFEDIIHGL